MKLVQWTDDRGYYHLSLIRNSDPEELGPKGVPYDPPDLDNLDWERIKREIHNLLVSKRLSTWEDVKRSQNGITSTVNATLKRELILLYRHKATEDRYAADSSS